MLVLSPPFPDPALSRLASTVTLRPDDYLNPYRHALALHGPDFCATLWRSRASQLARFEAILASASFARRRILDAGCGLGCLAHFLNARDAAYSHYTGIDAVPEVLDQARSGNPPRSEFLVGDFVADRRLLSHNDPDFVIFCGSLNTLDEALAWEVVDDAWDAARVGLIFNFLSDLCDPAVIQAETGPAHRFGARDWIDWTVRTTRHFQIRHDYLEGQDITIAMFKSCPSPADAPSRPEP